jgi:hypothetical protein
MRMDYYHKKVYLIAILLRFSYSTESLARLASPSLEF